MAPERSVTLEALGAWVIKCNPRKTSIEPMRAAGVVKPLWCVADNYRTRLIRPGQRVLFWVTSDPRRGIWGAGEITGAPFLDEEQWHVPVHIPLLVEPLTATALAEVPGLGGLEVFRSPQQANPSWVSAMELALIDQVLAASSGSAYEMSG